MKKILVEPDFAVWKEYAKQQRLHPAVISYLSARPRCFYHMETTVDGKSFVTPRGWEDLSQLLEVYEKLGKKADREVTVQYLQHDKIARDSPIIWRSMKNTRWTASWRLCWKKAFCRKN